MHTVDEEVKIDLLLMPYKIKVNLIRVATVLGSTVAETMVLIIIPLSTHPYTNINICMWTHTQKHANIYARIYLSACIVYLYIIWVYIMHCAWRYYRPIWSVVTFSCI